VGSGETSEGVGRDFSLPNDAYCESCAGAGMLFFQHQMGLLYGEARYADLCEDVLYNALLSDVDLSGKNFTYTNALETDESRYRWHVCPCCVGNIPRTILSLPTWMYTRQPDGLTVNLFVGSTTTVTDVAGTDVSISQSTNYPRDGKVILTLYPARPTLFALRIRVPGHDNSSLYTATPGIGGLEAVRVNGLPVIPAVQQGYARIQRTWTAGDQIEFTVPLGVQRVRANKSVVADRGRVALRYGPFVFNFETVDQPIDGRLDPTSQITPEWRPDFLGGVIVLRG
jgi:DUF1680 family protein